MGATCPPAPRRIIGMAKDSSRGPAWQKTRKAVLDRDGWVCTWAGCGISLEGSNATVDHVTPVALALSMGWSREQIDAPSNLVAMCRRHNGLKRDQISIRIDYLSPVWFDRPMVF